MPHDADTLSAQTGHKYEGRRGDVAVGPSDATCNEVDSWMTDRLAPVVQTEVRDFPLDLFHHRVCEIAGRAVSKSGRAPARYTRREDKARRDYQMPKWYDDIVPSPFFPGMTARCMLTLGSCLKGTLVRLMISSIDHLTEVGHSNVNDTQEPHEIRHRAEWADEAKIVSNGTASRTATLVGTGIVGALDGLIASPLIAYPQFQWTMIPAPMMAVSRLLRGNVVSEARYAESLSDTTEWDAYCDAVRRHAVTLFAIREKNHDAYVWSLKKLISDALLSWGECGWLHHELESGDVARAEDVVCVDRAVSIMDRSIRLYIDDYIFQYGRHAKRCEAPRE